jgi:plasmid stabilization system protein ParE
MKVRILPPAMEDLADGRTFYDSREKGVGAYFMDSLFSEIDSLSLYAGLHAIRLGHYRMIARRFPFAIYYQIEGDTAVVHRVLDCRRDPSWIRNSLKK